MTAPDVHALTGAYALDALTDLERASFDRHLRDCPVCEQEVREFRATTALLGAAVSVEPGDSLRDRVLSQITATPQLPPVVTYEKTARNRSSRRWARRAGIGILAAAAAAAAIVGGVNLGQPQPAQNQAQSVPGSAVRSASDAVTVAGNGIAGGQATAVVSRGQGQFVLDIHDFPALDSAHSYQGWMIGPRGPQSAGVLHAGGRTGVLTGDIPADTKSIGITVEPAGGSPQPTTTGVVAITLA
jgi:anti-sigma-K factor RskA